MSPLTLVTNPSLNGGLIAYEAVEQLEIPLAQLQQRIRIGNTIDAALPILNKEFHCPQLMPKNHAVAAIMEVAHSTEGYAERNSLQFLAGHIASSKFTHFWVA